MLHPRQQKALAAMYGAAVGFDVSMADFCTLKAGGRAAAFIEVGDPDKLSALLGFCRKEEICRRIMSIPVASSETQCSTWTRVFISIK